MAFVLHDYGNVTTERLVSLFQDRIVLLVGHGFIIYPAHGDNGYARLGERFEQIDWTLFGLQRFGVGLVSELLLEILPGGLVAGSDCLFIARHAVACRPAQYVAYAIVHVDALDLLRVRVGPAEERQVAAAH